MMQVDHQFEENLTEERIDAIIERLRQPLAAAAPAPATAASETPKRKPAAPKRARSEG